MWAILFQYRRTRRSWPKKKLKKWRKLGQRFRISLGLGCWLNKISWISKTLKLVVMVRPVTYNFLDPIFNSQTEREMYFLQTKILAAASWSIKRSLQITLKCMHKKVSRRGLKSLQMVPKCLMNWIQKQKKCCKMLCHFKGQVISGKVPSNLWSPREESQMKTQLKGVFLWVSSP